MPITHHPLTDEFPEYVDAIRDLKMNNAHFRRLAHEYEGIDKEIFRAEQEIEIVNDDYLSLLKKERLNLKDIIYNMLKS